MRFSRFATAAVLLAAALAANRRFDRLVALAATRAEVDRKTFAQFPPAVGKWRVENVGLTERQLELLAVDDYLRADCTAGSGRVISVYVGYYTNPDRATRHPPTICYPGAGWVKEYEGSAVLEIPGFDSALPVALTLFERGGSRQMVIYWYSLSGYTASSATWQKIARVRSILAGRPIAGASKIQIAVDIEGNREEAQEEIEEFLAEFLPALDGFIPQGFLETGVKR